MDNLNQSSEVKTQKTTLSSVLAWIYGIFFGIGGLGMLSSHVIAGLIVIVSAILVFPPISRLLKSRLNFSMSRGIKIVSVIVLLIIAGVAMGNTKTAGVNTSAPVVSQSTSTQSSPVATAPTQPQLPQVPQTLEQQITDKVNAALSVKTNMGKLTVVKVEIDPYIPADLKQYGYASTDKINGILITINASENLTTNLQKGTMDDEASKVFQAIFPLTSQIGDVIVWAQLPVKDQYGNQKDDTAIVFAMANPLYQKINWSSFNHRDLPDLLTNESTIDDRNAYQELIKF